jgi:hypothetical protein
MDADLEQFERALRWRQQSFATGHGSGHGARLRITKTLHAFEGHQTMKLRVKKSTIIIVAARASRRFFILISILYRNDLPLICVFSI